jgi:hypothetical protein
VGIGTDTPAELLDVRGSIKLHSDGSLFAPGGIENLRVVRGSIDAAGAIIAGTGFACAKLGLGSYRITFTQAFPSTPSIVCTTEFTCNIGIDPATRTNALFDAIIWDNPHTVNVDQAFEFIATGPR